MLSEGERQKMRHTTKMRRGLYSPVDGGGADGEVKQRIWNKQSGRGEE